MAFRLDCKAEGVKDQVSSKSDWDEKYRAADRSFPEPDGFLSQARQYVPKLGEHHAVDIACGDGRHALCMAGWGLRTAAIDYSIEALRLCKDRATLAGLALETLCVDLESPGVDLGIDRFDVVAVFNFLHRPLIPILKRCVRPGGIVIYKTYTRGQTEFGTGPRNPKFLLGDGELPDLFSDFRHILFLESCESDATAALVAQRR